MLVQILCQEFWGVKCGTGAAVLRSLSGDAARFVGQPPVLEIRGRIDSTVKIRGFKVPVDWKPLWWLGFLWLVSLCFFCRVLRKLGHDVS